MNTEQKLKRFADLVQSRSATVSGSYLEGSAKESSTLRKKISTIARIPEDGLHELMIGAMAWHIAQQSRELLFGSVFDSVMALVAYCIVNQEAIERTESLAVSGKMASDAMAVRLTGSDKAFFDALVAEASE